MGIPRFYRWMSERYPCLSEIVREAQVPEFDNLYLDMNGIIHNCSHPNDDDVHFRISEEDIFRNIFRYIEFLFSIIKPRKVFFMAVDGVAPRAKMNQQRGRRFRSAKEAEMKEKEARNRGEILPTEARFDSNCITPGTTFMVKLHEHLKYFIATKITTDESWREPKIYFSGHETPGEGEHKIMDFIRFQKSQPDYNPYTRHCLYGLDADLIKLGMCSHEPYFSLLREEVKFIRSTDKKASRKVNPERITFHLLHLSLLRDYIDLEFSQLKTILPFDYNLENIIDDWVLMGFLVGNDFIPNIPHFHISNDSLSTLYSVYTKVLPQLDGYLNENGYLNLTRFQRFLNELANIDKETFSENLADLKYFEGKLGRKLQKPSKKLVSYFDDDDVVPEVQLENDNSNLNRTESNSDDDCEIIIDSESLTDSEMDESDLLEEEFRVHKKDYYETKLLYDNCDESVLKEQAYCYIRAIQWNLHYYYNGCVSWSWYYPHHYAPYISDIKDFRDVDLNFECGEPFKPYEQLLAVLPSASKDFLPKAYQKLVTDESSPLIDYYPEDFETDQNEKKNSWESVVLIPFIEEKKLVKAAAACNNQLSEEEKNRNKHGPHLLFTYCEQSCGKINSPNLKVFPDLVNNHAKCSELPYTKFWISPSLIKRTFLETKDVYFPGFPTLKHVAFTASLKRDRVRVFEMPSQNYNMILSIKENNNYDLEDVLREFLGKIVLVNWPHLYQAKVVKVTDKTSMYSINNNSDVAKLTLTDKEKIELVNKENSIACIYKERKGIVIGETSILLIVVPFAGFKYDANASGNLLVKKQWSNIETVCPIQTVVKNLNIYDSFTEEFKSISDLFPVGQKCFVLCNPHYGEMAEVLQVDESTGKVKVRIYRTLEPDLTEVIERQNDLICSEYLPNFMLAQKFNLSGRLVSRIMGTIFVRREKKNVKENIGLNLKFNTRALEVPGFSKKIDDQWFFSSKAQQMLEEYMQKFPFILENLDQNVENDVFSLSDLFPLNDAEALLDNVLMWLKSLPSSQVPRRKVYANSLDECIVKAIEDVVNTQKVFSDELDTVDYWFKPSNLFRPMRRSTGTLPDPNTKYRLFDRVINVREGISVPLGAKGIIIGIRTDNFRSDNTLYEIVFDEEFVGDMPLSCSHGKGYKLPAVSLINISYGSKKNAGISQRSLSSIQAPFRRDQKEVRDAFDDRKHYTNTSKGSQSKSLYHQNNVIPSLEFSSRSYTRQIHNRLNHSQNSPFESIPPRGDNTFQDYPSLWLELQRMQGESATRTNVLSNSNYSPRGKFSSSDDVFRTVRVKEKSPLRLTSAVRDLQNYYLKENGEKPKFWIELMGPMRNRFACVRPPNGQLVTHPVGASVSEMDAFEMVAQKAMRHIDQNYRTLLLPTFINQRLKNDNQSFVLPLPPKDWIVSRPVGGLNTDDTIHQIPESFVAENQKILDSHLRQKSQERSQTNDTKPKSDCTHYSEGIYTAGERKCENEKDSVGKAKETRMRWNVSANPFVPLQVTRMNQLQVLTEQTNEAEILTPENIAQNERFQSKPLSKNKPSSTIQPQKKCEQSKNRRLAVNFSKAP